jgi:hypothetical protein
MTLKIPIDPLVDGLKTHAYDLCHVLDRSPSCDQKDGLPSLVSPHLSDVLESFGELVAIRPLKPKGCGIPRYSHETSLLSKSHFSKDFCLVT